MRLDPHQALALVPLGICKLIARQAGLLEGKVLMQPLAVAVIVIGVIGDARKGGPQFFWILI
jgi:hypothetical protein